MLQSKKNLHIKYIIVFVSLDATVELTPRTANLQPYQSMRAHLTAKEVQSGKIDLKIYIFREIRFTIADLL